MASLYYKYISHRKHYIIYWFPFHLTLFHLLHVCSSCVYYHGVTLPKHVFINSIFCLVNLQLFSLMQAHDVGCGPGGGPTTPIVFKVCPAEGLYCPNSSLARTQNCTPFGIIWMGNVCCDSFTC